MIIPFNELLVSGIPLCGRRQITEIKARDTKTKMIIAYRVHSELGSGFNEVK